MGIRRERKQVNTALSLYRSIKAVSYTHLDVYKRQDLEGGYLNATDLADYLAAKGLPFRSAHAVSGKLVQYAEQTGRKLTDLSLEEMRAECPLFEEDIYAAIAPAQCLAARKTLGGPAPEAVEIALQDAKTWLEKHN